MKSFTALSVCCVTMLLAGCVILQRNRAEAIPPDLPKPLIVLEKRSADHPIAGSAIFTPAAGSVTFDVVVGDEKSPIVFKRERTSRFGAGWTEAEADVRAEFYRINDEGDVLLTAAIDHEERVISLFDPPLTAVYATLAPGTPLVQEVGLRIMDLRNPQRQRESGTAKQTIEHQGQWRIRTTQGDFIADCVSVKFEARMRFARAKRESTLYVVEGIGLIAAEHEETVTALGLFSRTSRQTLLRRDVAVAASDKP